LKYLLQSINNTTIENNKTKIINPNVYLISGCKDDQVSADYFNVNTNQFAGALTTSFLHTVNQHNHDNITFYSLITNMNKYLKRNNFTQIPQVSSNFNINNNSYYRKNNNLLVQYSPPPVNNETKPQKNNKPRKRFRNRREYLLYLRYIRYLQYIRRLKRRGRRR
jgi:hypothetical protein